MISSQNLKQKIRRIIVRRMHSIVRNVPCNPRRKLFILLLYEYNLLNAVELERLLTENQLIYKEV